ncbi:MAG: hypothetical protein HQM03_03050 [Magnetococcales bacterium]|nr:hypothetical protein [Magnetococcales bacterium]
MFQFVKWIFAKIVPYGVGIGVGVLFFFLLTRYAPTPEKPHPVPPGAAKSQTLATREPVATTAPPVKPIETPATAPVAKPAPEPVAPVAKPAPEPVAPVAKPAPEPVAPVAKPAPVVPVAPAQIAAQVSEPVADPIAEPDGASVPAPAPVAAQPPQDVVTAPSRSSAAPTAQNWSPSAQWQAACQERLAMAKRMVEDGRARCPASGYMRQNCLDYYRDMEWRYQGARCD